MAEIAPFRGLRYNMNRIPDLSKVVIPPYDVISPEEQERFHELSPFNMVRLELGMKMDRDSQEENAHRRAARNLQQWREEGILLRDETPSVYYYELDYDLPGKERQTRRGFICALRLEDFSSGNVRPHEKTFQAVKDERLALMNVCRANLSPVFALYGDPGQEVDHFLREGKRGDPAVAFQDEKGMEHRVWLVQDTALLKQVKDRMQDKTLFIADGHHRYETAINFRNLQRREHPHAGPNASFEFIMVYLSNMNQEGLTILPTHRMLKNLGNPNPEEALHKARDFFTISTYGVQEGVQEEWERRLSEGAHGEETVIGLLSAASDSFHILRSKRESIDGFLARAGVSSQLRSLDVVILDQVLLKHIMGLSESFLANEHNIHFKHDFEDALDKVKRGVYDLGFFINPTRIDQVQRVAEAGLIMPHKSTYFYPKVGSGLVIRPLLQEEEAVL